MNIAIDIEPIVTLSRYRGMGVYTKNLLAQMFAQDKINNYFLFSMYEDLPINELIPMDNNVHSEYFYMGKDMCLLAHKLLNSESIDEKYLDLIGALYKKFIENNNIDTFFLTATLDKFCNYRKEWFKDVNLALIVYDIIPFLFSEEYVKGQGGQELCAQAVDLWKSADVLLAISQSVKDDLIKYLGIDESKIKVIYSGVDTEFLKTEHTKEQVKATLNKLKITGEYLVFPSANDYRKNLSATIEAYSMFDENSKYQLVVTGDLNEDMINRMEGLIQEKGLVNKVILTNYISTDELVILYKNAKLLVFPSLYEGFGLPVIEAFACGLNVLTSNNSSLGEVAKDAAVIVDPYDKSSIAQGISTALHKTDFASFKEVINERLKMFTWENTAKLTLQALDLPKKQIKSMEKKQKLAYFAPLNTKNSMLKNCYINTLNVLMKDFEVSVFVEEQKDITLSFDVPVFNAREFAAYAINYDKIVYQMANYKENIYMLSSLLQFKGTVILQDLNIHPGVYEYYIKQCANFDGYVRALTTEINNFEEIAAQIKHNEELFCKVASELDFINCITDNAKHIIVSDEYYKEKLLQNDIGCDVHVLMPYVYENNQTETENKVALAGSITSIDDITSIVNAGNKLKAENIKYLFLNEQPLENEIKEQFSAYSLNYEFSQGISEDEYISEVQKAFVTIKLPKPSYKEQPLEFYKLLINCQSMIALDNSVPKEYDKQLIDILTYEDKSYHMYNTLEKLLKEKEYKKRMQNGIKELLSLSNIEENLSDIVMNTCENVVTEKLIKQIYTEDLRPRGLNTEAEMKRIAQTLAYIKEKKKLTARIESTNNEINSKAIMQDIHSELNAKGIDVLKGKG